MLVRKNEPELQPVPEEIMVRPPENDAQFNSELWRLTTPGLDEDAGLMLFQLPSVLPIPALQNGGGGTGAGPSASAAAAGSSYGRDSLHPSAAGSEGSPSPLSELPSGKIGKIYVLRNGSVKIQIGEVLFDVAPGIPGRMLQELAAVDPATRECTFLGDIQQRIVVTPDMDALLSGEPLPAWRYAEPDALGAPGAAGVADGAAGPAEDMQRYGTSAGANGHAMEVDNDAGGNKNKVKSGGDVRRGARSDNNKEDNSKIVLVGNEEMKTEVEGAEVGAVGKVGKQERKGRR